jgi:hypothetical protein
VVDLELEARLKGLTEMLPSSIRLQVSGLAAYGKCKQQTSKPKYIACHALSARLLACSQVSRLPMHATLS